MAAARPEGLLLVAQSNAGLPQVVGDHFEYDATPADMAAPRRAPARPRHRPDRRLLRLDPGARARDQPRPGMTVDAVDGAVVGEDGVARCPWAGAARHDARLPRHRVGRAGPRRAGTLRADVPRGLPGRAVLVDDPEQARPVPRGLPRLRRRPGRGDDRRRRRAAAAPTPASSATGPRSRPPARTQSRRSPCARTAGSRRSSSSSAPQPTPSRGRRPRSPRPRRSRSPCRRRCASEASASSARPPCTP